MERTDHITDVFTVKEEELSREGQEKNVKTAEMIVANDKDEAVAQRRGKQEQLGKRQKQAC